MFFSEARGDPARDLFDGDRPFGFDDADRKSSEQRPTDLVRLRRAVNGKDGPHMSRELSLDGLSYYEDRRLACRHQCDWLAMIRAHDRDACFGGVACGAKRVPKPVDFSPAIVKPVGAPNPMEAPSEMLQDILPQAVTLASPKRIVIGRPVASDRENVGARTFRMSDSQINAKASGPNLRIGEEAEAPGDVNDVLLKWRFGQFTGGHPLVELSRLGEFQKLLEDYRPLPTHTTEVDIAGVEGCKYLTTHAGAGKKYVQTSAVAIAIDWPE